ncbi:glycerol kinase GlpK [Alienimonas californiensis]|uniref:glycerol kinase n=1 Tax=Alienimonas californiensis TaxID=2527989 RepID=A0A517PCB6_9PLAN|nr:glycerol kinase GlpK [Alienimonas californiensis]QDT17023.1 Glycerol kinase [Alienimonas californiensis]
MTEPLVLALDQGTTSSRALLFAADGRVVAGAQREFPQLFPQPGAVEHDPEAIWDSQLATAKEALAAGFKPAALGLTNQRETVVLWDRTTGRPVTNAIVWQSRVSAPVCERLKGEGLEPLFRDRTGLLLDPYFTGTKLTHLFETHAGLRARCERGDVLAGTVDSFLLWRLTGGRRHVTDASNASRTLLFNLSTGDWDEELCGLLNVPRACLPEIVDSAGRLTETDPAVLGERLPVCGLAGDQQAATFGQGCLTPGSAKNTYGTGCFLLMNTGGTPVPSANRLLTTVGWRIGGRTTFCLEGAVLVAGAAVQWLRDGLGLFENAAEVEALAETVPDAGGVTFVPAFVGLGAPYWRPDARGTIAGITRGTTRGHIARAALEAIAHRTRDVVEAMNADLSEMGKDGAGLPPLTRLNADGGASRNDLLMQTQADLLGVPVRRTAVAEITAFGAARLAGLGTGVWPEEPPTALCDRDFLPRIDPAEADRRHAAWGRAVRGCLPTAE